MTTTKIYPESFAGNSREFHAKLSGVLHKTVGVFFKGRRSTSPERLGLPKIGHYVMLSRAVHLPEDGAILHE